MALEKGVNSYSTVEEADSYFEDRIDSSVWEDSDDTEKAQALVTATKMLDNLDWIGTVALPEQVLAFPRIGTFFDTRLGYTARLDPLVVPDRIVESCYELAIHLLSNEGLRSSSSSALDIEVGPIKLTTLRQVSKFPSAVKTPIRNLLLNGGSRVVWRAN